ncbi:MAG: hypothetical protein AB1726_13510 [Planctomycetota bacterium]
MGTRVLLVLAILQALFAPGGFTLCGCPRPGEERAGEERSCCAKEGRPAAERSAAAPAIGCCCGRGAPAGEPLGPDASALAAACTGCQEVLAPQAKASAPEHHEASLAALELLGTPVDVVFAPPPAPCRPRTFGARTRWRSERHLSLPLLI